MKITISRLHSPAIYLGPDFFGRASYVELKPCPGDGYAGWFQRPHSFHDADAIPMNPDRVTVSKRNLVFVYDQSHKLYIVEHLLPLRFVIPNAILAGSGKPPYDGCSEGFWEAAESHVSEEEIDIPLYTTETEGCFEYNGKRGGHKSFTRISPWQGGLRIRIVLSYRGLGEIERRFIFPAGSFGKVGLFKPFFGVGAQGWWPEWAKLIIKMVKWRHANRVVWPDFKNPGKTLELFVIHRVLDLLGGLAFLCRDGFFCGEIDSVCSGHLGDIKAINQVYPSLYRFS